MNIRTVIFFPLNTNRLKVERVQSYGGEFVRVELHGTDFEACEHHAELYAETHHLTLVKSDDNASIIEGEASLAIELLEDFDGEIDFIYCPVSGGGLYSGIVSYILQISPNTQVIGCRCKVLLLTPALTFTYPEPSLV